MSDAYTLSGKKVFVSGHGGMVGSALLRRLEQENVELITATRAKLDLRSQEAVQNFMARTRPQMVVIAAATVGGIMANSSRPAEFLYDNLMIESNLIEAAYRNDVEKLVFLGSSCIYPKHAAQPMKEEELLTGPLEPTNQWYAIAKITGIKLTQAYREQYGSDFISVMPTNLYGPGDNFNLDSAHVIPALMRKAWLASREKNDRMEVWGTGKVKREFLYVDDLADALVFLAKTYSGPDHVNVGIGQDISVAELAQKICDTVGFEGQLEFDPQKPDGTPRKLLDVSKINAMGWKASTSLGEGLEKTFQWFQDNHATARF